MANYIASYDLHNQRHYEPVWAQLERWGATRLLESLWVFSSPLTAAELRNALHAAADSDDSIAVIELKYRSDWATWSGESAGVAWMKQNLG